MKKRIILTILLGCLLTGCGQNAEVEEKEEAVAQEADMVLVTKEDINSYFSTVEITLDNWQDYFEVAEKEEIETDSFGEETGAKYAWKVINPKENVKVNDDLVMRFSIEIAEISNTYFVDTDEAVYEATPYERNTDEDIEAWDFYPSAQIYQLYNISEPYITEDKEVYHKSENDIKKCELTKVVGSVTVANIPNHVWNTDENGDRFVAVEKEEENIAKFYENGNYSDRDMSETITNVNGEQGIFQWRLDRLE